MPEAVQQVREGAILLSGVSEAGPQEAQAGMFAQLPLEVSHITEVVEYR